MGKTRKPFPAFPYAKNTQNIILALFLSLLVIYYIYLVKAAGITAFDDAYMFIRYANNFLNGHGIAWNSDGIQTYGVTSILYFVIVTTARSILPHVDTGALLTIISAALGLTAIAVLAHTCSRFASSHLPGSSFVLFAAVFMAYFVTSPVFVYHMTTGMDTTLSFLCNAVLIFCLMRWIYQKDKYVSLLVLTIFAGYLTYLARPDNIIHMVIFPFLGIILLSSSDKKQRLIHYFGCLFLVLSIDTLIKFIVFHDPLPLPFYAKSSGYYEGYKGVYAWNPISYLFEMGRFVLPFLIIIIFSSSKHTQKLLLTFTLPAILTFVYYFKIIQIMGYGARYYFPSAPYLIVVSLLMLNRHIQSEADNAYQETANQKITRLILIFLVVSIFSQSTIETISSDTYKRFVVSSTPLYTPLIEYTTSSAKSLPQRGWWTTIHEIASILEKLPDDTRFASSEYGYISAKVSNIYIVDLAGLNDPYFAHYGFSANELFNRKPDLIWFHSDYTKIVASIVDSKEFWEQYEYYPSAFNYGIAIRKDSPNYDEIYMVINKTWEELYFTRKMKDYLARPTIN